MNLKAAFSKEQIRFKDVRGSWSIDIFFENDIIRVSHNKKEQSYDETFDFEWKFSIEFDREMSQLLKTEFGLERVNWGNVTQETRTTVRKVVKETFDYVSNI